MKRFNTTALCIPEKHYMVDISERVKEIKKYVDDGKYFTINRARQYGKTTTLNELHRGLEKEYSVIDLSFEGLSTANFASEQSFVKAFCRLFKRNPALYREMPPGIKSQFEDFVSRKESGAEMDELFLTLGEWCAVSDKPIVMLIDEVDSASNNQVFLDFLSQLREGYIRRDRYNIPTFQSVILAGVTDVKHLKSKIRDDGASKVNSPWNIAVDFTIDMSLSQDGIKGMLDEYEADHETGMDTEGIARAIREYTNGYPFLVSRICELIDTRAAEELGDLKAAWTMQGFDYAIKLLLNESNTLFDSLVSKLHNYPELKEALKSILMKGEKLTYNPDQSDIAQMKMYGFIRNEDGTVKIDNRIFETRLYNLFLSDEELKRNVFCRTGDLEKNIFIEGGKLNVRLILERFIVAYHEICGPLLERFGEKDGREQFLLYLKPIINGTGNFYIEAQTRDQRRTDVVIDYLGIRYIIELKIWRGERYNADGEKQVSEYLDYFGLDTGYMLSFNFNKNKETGVKRMEVGDKVLFEGTV